MTERHAFLLRFAPTPYVLTSSCPKRRTFFVSRPSSTSVTCPAPKRWPVRYTHESTFCAATVPSHVSTGSRQLSQLPHCTPPIGSPK